MQDRSTHLNVTHTDTHSHGLGAFSKRSLVKFEVGGSWDGGFICGHLGHRKFRVQPQIMQAVSIHMLFQQFREKKILKHDNPFFIVTVLSQSKLHALSLSHMVRVCAIYFADHSRSFFNRRFPSSRRLVAAEGPPIPTVVRAGYWLDPSLVVREWVLDKSAARLLTSPLRGVSELQLV